MRAHLAMLQQPRKAADAELVAAGLRACGFSVHKQLGARLLLDDVFVCWNRTGMDHTTAKRFEQAGCKVLVLENGYMGAQWNGKRWFALSRNHHNGWGQIPNGGPERWDSWGVELAPLRAEGEAIVLAQRGIAEPAQRPPPGYFELCAKLHNARIRRHPGADPNVPPWEVDMRDCALAITWSSASAIRASVECGARVVAGLPRWIGEGLTGKYPDRLPALRRIAWGMWTAEEIGSGVAFERVLAC